MTDTTGKVAIKRKCADCKNDVVIYVYPDDVRRYRNGVLVQDAFPYLNENDREILVSGICGTCFDALFDEAPSKPDADHPEKKLSKE